MIKIFINKKINLKYIDNLKILKKKFFYLNNN